MLSKDSLSKSQTDILILDAFHTGSHKMWSTAYKKFSSLNIEILSMPGRNWKWRMHGAAIYFAEKIKNEKILPKMILCTDMTDLSTLRSLTESFLPNCRYGIYFHENQLSYPWSPSDEDVKLKRDIHYAFINYSSALSADNVYFNSGYHQKSFIYSCNKMLSHFPDFQLKNTIDELSRKSKVLHLGLKLKEILNLSIKKNPTQFQKPVILWNHRWEFDKNPEEFFETLIKLDSKGIEFSLLVLGESYTNSPEIFKIAKEKLSHKILHFGYVDSKEEYFQWLLKSDILGVTGFQDFFGGSVVEAMAAGCLPLLPDRLAYPEHIPGELKEKFIYKKEESFETRLIQLIKNYDELKIYASALKKHIQKYDWEKTAPIYDEEFQGL